MLHIAVEAMKCQYIAHIRADMSFRMSALLNYPENVSSNILRNIDTCIHGVVFQKNGIFALNMLLALTCSY